MMSVGTVICRHERFDGIDQLECTDCGVHVERAEPVRARRPARISGSRTAGARRRRFGITRASARRYSAGRNGNESAIPDRQKRGEQHLAGNGPFRSQMQGQRGPGRKPNDGNLRPAAANSSKAVSTSAAQSCHRRPASPAPAPRARASPAPRPASRLP